MNKKKEKLINLDIKTIQFPVTAVVSILHRISGIILFISIGPILNIFRLSLSSNESFIKISNFFLNIIFAKFFLWSIIAIFCYHVIAGIRQILMDFGILKQTFLIGKISAYIVFMIMIISSIIIGIFI